jgi:peptidoglycan/LPS O-acetylase OafA/YrhL
MKTIGGIIEENNGVGPGFDVLRIALASAVLSFHVTIMTHVGAHIHLDAPVEFTANGQKPIWTGFTRPILVSLVPMFFALSGFLVTGSAMRLKKTSTFIGHRALRIFPALFVEVALSAIVLGSIFTSLPLAAYFNDPKVFRYFGNIVGLISFSLPGVFLNNRLDVVNYNLWTLPAEFDCYAITGLLMVSGLFYRRFALTCLLILCTIVFIYMNITSNFAVTSGAYDILTITYYFFVGSLFYQWRELIPFGSGFLVLATVASYILLLSVHTIFLAPIFLTYVTVGIGMIKFPRLPLIATGDYSYGLYLYGFPISQAIVATFPLLAKHKIPFIVIAYSVSFLFAAFSWHMIEKHALSLRHKLPKRFFPVPERSRGKGVVAAPAEGQG